MTYHFFQKIGAGIVCGILAMLFSPIVILFLSAGVIIVGYTKMGMICSFIWGYVCGFSNEFHGNIDHERIQQNIRLNDQRLDRIRRIRELQRL